MRTLTAQEYSALRDGARVIEADGFGDKVLLLNDGSFLKLFRRKRLLSSALIFPYSTRFTLNAGLLAERGIPSVTIIDNYRIPTIRRTAVHYQPLPGETLRHLLKDATGDSSGLMGQLGTFIARLHEKGVYFRSLHLGNVVLTPDHELGLIDIADMSCGRLSLGPRRALRNFHHLARSKVDMELLDSTLRKRLIEAYGEASGRSDDFQAALGKVLQV
ncbi:toluene tolerance protein [Kistimonas asteriae]|uniref:toluene tolerance protein n=1 Tax=Kistimonas asteriae TaxID=517724 RepID=UPI001BAAB296|nr:toluene tolerance protein [Kistimonas asteriae]